MKALLILLFTATLSLQAAGQRGEFVRYPNGLIYSDTTMRQLRHIVDSMNLKFRRCDPSKTYYGARQGRAHWMEISGPRILTARQDILDGISFEAFAKKYPEAELEKNLMVTQYTDTSDWKGGSDKLTIVYQSVAFDDLGEHEVSTADTSLPHKNMAGKWVFRFWPQPQQSDEACLSAFYFPEDFTTTALPSAYSRLVQYTDCMIDTGSTVFFSFAQQDDMWSSTAGKKKPEFAQQAGSALYAYLAERSYFRKDGDGLYRRVAGSDSLARAQIRLIAGEPAFRQLLQNAFAECRTLQTADVNLENMAEWLGYPAEALYLKRSRVIVGFCSQDNRPRYQAQDIARLAAQNVQWDIFLRSHLDLMNDCFERVANSNIAEMGRGTYIRELEELDFNVEDLLLGVSLQISNPSGGHYFGNISRTGRALSEYRRPAALEKRLAAMISDPQLDLYNRVILFFLYDNYRYYRDGAIRPYAADPLLAAAKKTLPGYITAQLDRAQKRQLGKQR